MQIHREWPNRLPAIPANIELITNDKTLKRVVSTPIASAAISSSRMEMKARP